MKTPNWIQNAYRTTDVNWAKSQTVIHKMLNELGVFDVRFTNIKDRFALEFLITLEEGKPRAVRIVVPMMYKGDDENKRQKELNTLHRILVAHLKAKFIAIGRGLTEFEEEFMSHLVITDKFGNSKTMGEALLPQYRENIDNGENKDFKLLGNGS